MPEADFVKASSRMNLSVFAGDGRMRPSPHEPVLPQFALAVDFCFAQLSYGGFGAYGGIVDLFKCVRTRLGVNHG